MSAAGMSWTWWIPHRATLISGLGVKFYCLSMQRNKNATSVFLKVLSALLTLFGSAFSCCDSLDSKDRVIKGKSRKKRHFFSVDYDDASTAVLYLTTEMLRALIGRHGF